jgi:metal-sulfur cluster biosynthetic enzyme
MTLDDDVRAALRRVVDPCSIATGVPIDLIDMGLVREVTVRDGAVSVTLQLTSPFCLQIGQITEQIQHTVAAATGIAAVTVEIDHHAEWMPEYMATHSRDALRRLRPMRHEPRPSSRPAVSATADGRH